MSKCAILCTVALTFGSLWASGLCFAGEVGAEQHLRRFAIVVGSNDGGDNRIYLKYAHKDAEKMAAILETFGGVAPSDLLLLEGTGRFDLEAAFAKMRRMLTDAGQSGTRREILFYYSGHSDEQGILLGNDTLFYREFKEALADLPADVRIAILDSCSSGALTRGKGGSRRPSFLMDASVSVKGHAFMTSASADEAAQESDAVGGSYYTHYLTVGLRGAADSDGDRRVTLNEAYNFAFQNTLARTESTRSGPQHANYDFQLKGSGDLVLTDLRRTSATLVVPADITGRLFIRNHKGELTAELNKADGATVALSMDPGTYKISLERENGLFTGTVMVSNHKQTVLALHQLDSTRREITATRGNLGTRAGGPSSPARVKDAIVTRAFQFGVFPGGISILPLNLPEGPKLNYFVINFVGDGHYLRGVELGMLGSIRYDDVQGFQASGLFNFNTGRTFGFQAAGLFNTAEDLNGHQAAGLFNLNTGNGRGMQASGLFNLNRGKFDGMQASGLFNFTGEGRGFKAAGLFNYADGPSQGMHAAGLFNVVNGPTRGFTASGLLNLNTSSSHGFLGAGLVNFNSAGSSGFMGAGLININQGAYNGFQGAGLVNVSAYDISRGYQASGLLNYAETVEGAQMAGLVNIARESVSGVQIGLVNIGGDVKGAQLGLVNVALGDLDGPQIGLVNTGGGYYLAPTFWSSGASYMNMGLKFGGNFTYAILAYGIAPEKNNERSSLIYGFGGRMNFKKIWLEIDAVSHLFMDEYRWTKHYQDSLYQFRPTVGYKVLKQLSIYAGPALNLLVSEVRKEAELIPGFWSLTASDGTNLRMSIDFTAGLQWEPQGGKLNKMPVLGQQQEKEK